MNTIYVYIYIYRYIHSLLNIPIVSHMYPQIMALHGVARSWNQLSVCQKKVMWPNNILIFDELLSDYLQISLEFMTLGLHIFFSWDFSNPKPWKLPSVRKGNQGEAGPNKENNLCKTRHSYHLYQGHKGVFCLQNLLQKIPGSIFSWVQRWEQNKVKDLWLPTLNHHLNYEILVLFSNYFKDTRQ